MKKFTARKKRVAITTAALVAIGGGAAFAYWTTTGAGSGTAQTGDSVAFDVDTQTATGGALTPGGPTQTIGFTVTNPGSGTQYLTTVTAEVANADGSDWTAIPGCSAADYTVSTPTFTPGEIAAGGNKAGTVTIQMVNAENRNQDACKKAQVPVYVEAK
jgi:hypothetical protein